MKKETMNLKTNVTTSIRQSLLVSVIAVATSASLEMGPSQALAASGKDAAYPYMDWGGFRSQSTVGRKKSSKKTSKKKKTDTPQALQEAASTELVIPEKEKSAEVVPTSATVTLKVEPVANPIVYSAFQLGVSVQAIKPVGQGTVEGLEPYDLGALGSKPMASVDFRWMPFEIEAVPNMNFGAFASVGYSQHKLDLKSPIGQTIDNTRLHTMKTQAGVAANWHLARAPRWSATGLLGGGRMDAIQSSNSSLASRSSTLPFASAALQGEYRLLDRWSLTAGYEYRQPLRNETAEMGMQRHNLLVGFLGSFR